VRGVSFVSVVHSAPTPKSEYHTLVLDILGLCLLFKQLISKSFGTIVTGLTFHMAQYIGFKIIKFSIPISKQKASHSFAERNQLFHTKVKSLSCSSSFFPPIRMIAFSLHDFFSVSADWEFSSCCVPSAPLLSTFRQARD
jgi:hypothetical protein